MSSSFIKAFSLGCSVAVMTCGVLWYIGMQKSAAPHPVADFPARVRPSPEAVGSLAELLGKSRSAAEAKEPLTAKQWKMLDAMGDEELSEWAESMKHDPRDSLWRAAMVRWASIDGTAAMARVQTLCEEHPATGDCRCCGGNPGGEFNELAAEMLASWIRREPLAAIAAMEVPETEPGMPSSPFPLETLAQTDFRSALDLVASQPMMKINAMAATIHVTLGNGGKSIDPDALGYQLDDPERRAEFVRWLENCDDENLASAMFSRIFSRGRHEGAWLQPANLPDFMPARERLPQELEDPSTVYVMGALSMGANPLEMLGATWLLKDCMAGWTYRDSESAGRWLEAQQPSTERDRAIIGYANGIWRDSPSQAVLWSAQISHTGWRIIQCGTYYPRWHLREPEKAEAWLGASDFSKVEQDYIAGKITGS